MTQYFLNKNPPIKYNPHSVVLLPNNPLRLISKNKIEKIILYLSFIEKKFVIKIIVLEISNNLNNIFRNQASPKACEIDFDKIKANNENVKVGINNLFPIL